VRTVHYTVRYNYLRMHTVRRRQFVSGHSFGCAAHRGVLYLHQSTCPWPNACCGHVVSEPVASTHVVSEPVASKHVVSEPVASKHVVSEPLARKHVVSEPVARKHVVSEPVPRKHVVSEPVASKPCGPEPVASKHGQVGCNAGQLNSLESSTRQLQTHLQPRRTIGDSQLRFDEGMSNIDRPSKGLCTATLIWRRPAE
jgi:hypothetical protein